MGLRMHVTAEPYIRSIVAARTCVRLYRLSAKAPSDSSRRCTAANARMAQGLLQRSSPLTRSHSARHCAHRSA